MPPNRRGIKMPHGSFKVRVSPRPHVQAFLSDPAVPRYFFHVLDGDWYLDQEGDDLPDLQTAIREAERVARDLLQDEAKGDLSHARLDVADEHGTVVHIV